MINWRSHWRSVVCLVGYTGSAILILSLSGEPSQLARIMAAAGALVLSWHCQECEESERGRQ